MLPVSLYTPVYHHAMLVVVIGFALLYWTGQPQARSLAHFNQVAMVVIGFGLALFIGFRPISGVYFVDMGYYAMGYEWIQQGKEAGSADALFNVLMRLCAPFLPTKGFFFVCALIYIAPLAVAAWRVHGVWAFPVFLAFLTAFSFWGYGTNGIRNGMALSVLILAFAFHDKPVLMFPLMATAGGLHGSVLLPAGAFLIVRYIKRTEVWLVFWVVCVVATLVGGHIGGMLLSGFNPFAFDNRVGGYILGGEGSGFRADFLAYSIVPVVVTLLLAAPPLGRLRRFAVRTKRSLAFNWMGQRSTMAATRMGMGRFFAVQGASPVGGFALAGLGATSHAPRSALGATRSTLPSSVAEPLRWMDNSSSRRNRMKADWSRQSQAKADQLSNLNPQPSTREQSSALGRLPWVQFLRRDPFYARLVNTYLLSNGIWVLLIHSEQSNRFAYLSWFMMPWVLLYPFVPGKTIDRPRTALIAAILCAQYLFTYVMGVVVYPMRGIL